MPAVGSFFPFANIGCTRLHGVAQGCIRLHARPCAAAAGFRNVACRPDRPRDGKPAAQRRWVRFSHRRIRLHQVAWRCTRLHGVARRRRRGRRSRSPRSTTSRLLEHQQIDSVVREPPNVTARLRWWFARAHRSCLGYQAAVAPDGRRTDSGGAATSGGKSSAQPPPRKRPNSARWRTSPSALR